MTAGPDGDGGERAVWTLALPPGGWTSPWPQVLELAEHLTPGSWTLVGGLMVHLHALRAGILPPRTTVDVDLLLHLETPSGSWPGVTRELGRVGYSLRRSLDTGTPSHRFVRVPTNPTGTHDQVDVLVADHPGPWALRARGGGVDLVRAPGGTSALRKTVRCLIEDRQVSRSWEVSVPDVLGALTLKGGAYQVDSRDRARHLEDAVVLCATIQDVDRVVEQPGVWTGSDPARIRALSSALAAAEHPAWGQLSDRAQRQRAQTTLRILGDGPVREG